MEFLAAPPPYRAPTTHHGGDHTHHGGDPFHTMEGDHQAGGLEDCMGLAADQTEADEYEEVPTGQAEVMDPLVVVDPPVVREDPPVVREDPVEAGFSWTQQETGTQFPSQVMVDTASAVADLLGKPYDMVSKVLTAVSVIALQTPIDKKTRARTGFRGGEGPLSAYPPYLSMFLIIKAVLGTDYLWVTRSEDVLKDEDEVRKAAVVVRGVFEQEPVFLEIVQGVLLPGLQQWFRHPTPTLQKQKKDKTHTILNMCEWTADQVTEWIDSKGAENTVITQRFGGGINRELIFHNAFVEAVGLKICPDKLMRVLSCCLEDQTLRSAMAAALFNSQTFKKVINRNPDAIMSDARVYDCLQQIMGDKVYGVVEELWVKHHDGSKYSKSGSRKRKVAASKPLPADLPHDEDAYDWLIDHA